MNHKPMLEPLKNALHHHVSNDLSRDRLLIDARDGIHVYAHGNQLINFSSNDYFSLSSHPDVKKAFTEGVERYGLGSGSAHLVSGYYKPHQLLEEAFCEFLNRARALLFNSGYHANLGVMTVFAKRTSTVIADKYCHASLIDGIRLSGANYYRYPHNSLPHAVALLQKQVNKKILVTESVFGMEGNISDIKQFAAYAKQYQAMLIVDDAHGVGVLGQEGKGICDYYHLSQEDVPCLITPLGKALGSFGAIVSGSTDLIESLVQFARTYCYTTAIPPAISHATLKALKILQHENWRREKLRHLIQFFTKGALERNLRLSSTDLTPIKSIIVKYNKKALAIQSALLKKGFLVSCIRPPTVPVNASRIKLTFNCLHTEEQITMLLDELYHLISHE